MKNMFCLVVLIAFVTGCATTKVAEVGDKAPTFELPVVASSDSLNLDVRDGKPVVVNFWSTSCSACIQELPDLNRIHNDETAVVIGIALDEDTDSVKRICQKNDINYEVALGTQKLFEQYDGYGIPYTLILDKNKTIRKRFRGKASYEDMASVLKKIETLDGSVALNDAFSD